MIRLLNIGVYISIIMRTTRSVFGLLSIMLVFIISLGIPLHILASSADMQLMSLGISLFSTFGNLVGLSDYDSIITMEVNGKLKYSVAVFLLLVVIVVVLPIVMINVILGLVLGDIAKLQEDATITHRKFEVLALYDIEKLNSALKVFPHLSKAKIRRYLNRKSVLNKLVLYFAPKYQPMESDTARKKDSSSVLELLQEDQKEMHRNIQQLQHFEGAQLQAIERLEAMMKRLIDKNEITVI